MQKVGAKSRQKVGFLKTWLIYSQQKSYVGVSSLYMCFLLHSYIFAVGTINRVLGEVSRITFVTTKFEEKNIVDHHYLLSYYEMFFLWRHTEMSSKYPLIQSTI